IAGGLSSLDSEDSIQVTKSANKQEVPNPIAGTANSNITYTLAVSASNSQSITLVDPIPSNAEFVSATGNYILNKDSGGIVTAVKWILSLSGGGQSGSSNTSPSTTLCGNKSTPPTGTAPNFSCTGKWGTTPVVDGYYIPTWFGCSTKYGKDPSDNCLPGCTSIPECSGISGPDCERNLKWFAADAGRYGCNSKLKVTNPQTGSAVVVKVIDYGPSCSVEKGRGKMDVSRDAQEAIGNSSLVHVEKVSDATALGPIPACTNQTQAVPQQSTQSLTFDTARFKQYGFPNPTSPTVMSDAAKNRWQKYMMPHAVKVASLLNIDIGWIGMWAWIEDSFNTYMDNCRDSEYNPNTYCSGWGGQWQVGYGNHPAYMLGYLKSAISAMHPGKTVQQIGQGVIDNSNVQDKYSGKFRPITTPATFPNKTADEILSGANRGSSESRMLLGILMKDDAIGTYLIGQHFKDLTSQHRGKLASVMNRWTSGGYYAPQKIINYIAGIYNVGISTNPASGGLATSSSVELTIRPKLSTVDTYIVNQAYTEGLGGITNTSNSTSASSLKNVPPSSNTCSIYKLSSYGNFGDPNCDFSKSQKALYVNNKYSLAKSSQRQWYSPSPLTDQLKRVDPLNATYWTGIAYCESSFNPNAINPNSPNPPAMGLMQMGKTADQGNAYWINQVENAVRYNNLLIKRGLPWRYWECARSVFKLW
ncbi:transglycosylase SLT domain-containing protein, partial [Patescibacteria group bacterium]|nr:transglycosylase SLT domain-containing protein [Patescibacteria group bacterium]